MSKILIIPLLFFSILFNNFELLAIDRGSSQEQGGLRTALGSSLDPSISLLDSKGERTSLGSLMADGKPLILIPSYYKCPRLCGMIFGAVAQLVKDMNLELGVDYKIATFSFNPVEGPELAQIKKSQYAKILEESGKSISGWEFFVGEKPQTQALINQLGFGIMAEGEEFAHSAAIFIINKSGKISQYFTDINFSPADVRLALVEASEGKIGTVMDQAMLFCYKFDPNKGKYTWAVGRVMQVLGALSILIVGGIIAKLIINERKSLT